MKVLAIDLGANSGRAILSEYHQGKLSIIEIDRFPSTTIEEKNVLYWDIYAIFNSIKNALRKCKNLGHDDLHSVSIDAWGVDFGLLDKTGDLIELPRHYRNYVTNKEVINTLDGRLGLDSIYEKTGIQILGINSIYQWSYLVKHEPKLIDKTKKMLFIPDLLNYFLTGVMHTEYSIASTSGLVNLDTRDWDQSLIKEIGMDPSVLPTIRTHGMSIGKLKQEIAAEIGLPQIDIILGLGHDTASAVMAIPFENKHSIFISSGTWSLLGMEKTTPIRNNMSYRHNFTNEGGYNQSIRYLKNINGLWILQEFSKALSEKGQLISFVELENKIASERDYPYVIDVEDESFQTVGNMDIKIKTYLEKKQMDVPETVGAYGKIILQSLAFHYDKTIKQLEQITEETISTIHMVGGGAQSKTLCQLTANYTKKKVIAGPIEATALGNVSIQLIANKAIESKDFSRKVIQNSMDIETYYPKEDNNRLLSLIF